MAQDDSKYTKPGLRESIKKRITAGSKGGKPGQRFCTIVRKAQNTQCKSFVVNAGSENHTKIFTTKDIHRPETQKGTVFVKIASL